jgi:hypothetical protein
MSAIRERPRTRALALPAARRIGCILAMALLAHGCIDGGEAPPEPAELTLAQIGLRPPSGGPGWAYISPGQELSTDFLWQKPLRHPIRTKY